jgi:adenylate cyclase
MTVATASEQIKRRLAAILAADVVGYSRLMERDETATYERLMARWREVLEPLVATHQGRIFKRTGDGVFVEFASAVNAVECAAALQTTMIEANEASADAPPIVLRIGINLGDVMVDETDLYGDGVNIAARLEMLAAQGGVAISDTVYAHVQGRVSYQFVDSGSHEVKNIARPIHIWTWAPPGITAMPAKQAEAPQMPDQPSIAVLPFDNMSGDPEQGYFADGITEDIITDLSKVSGLFVIARNSSFAYKGKSPDIRKVSRELGVRYVLEGSVRRSASRVRINAQMVDGTTGGHVWADRFDRQIEDIFEVQDEVTRTIVSALKVQLTASEQQRLDGRSKVDPEAYDLLVRARRTVMQLTPTAAQDARRMLHRVIEIDPKIALTYARLSIIAFADYANQWNGATRQNLDEARTLAEKAIAVDDTEPQGYIALALALSWQRDLDEAEKAAEHAVALSPNLADALIGLGNVREYQGRYEEAIPLYTRGYRLDPQFDMSLHFMGRALLALGRYDEAEIAFKRRLTFLPRSDMSRFYLTCVHGFKGENEAAHRVWEEMRQINPGLTVEYVKNNLPYRDAGLIERLAEGLRRAGIEV